MIFQNIKVIDSHFNNSTNDAIDLMQSKVLIENNFINLSGKGISIGEGTIVKIINNKFVRNNLAVAVKDNSDAKILTPNF